MLPLPVCHGRFYLLVTTQLDTESVSYWFTRTVHSHNFGQFIPATYLVTSYPAPIRSSNHPPHTTNHKSVQSINPSVNQSINHSIHPSIHPSIYLSMYIYTHTHTHTHTHTYIYSHPPMRLFVRLSKHPAAKLHYTKEQNFFTNLTASQPNKPLAFRWTQWSTAVFTNAATEHVLAHLNTSTSSQRIPWHQF